MTKIDKQDILTFLLVILSVIAGFLFLGYITSKVDNINPKFELKTVEKSIGEPEVYCAEPPTDITKIQANAARKIILKTTN